MNLQVDVLHSLVANMHSIQQIVYELSVANEKLEVRQTNMHACKHVHGLHGRLSLMLSFSIICHSPYNCIRAIC